MAKSTISKNYLLHISLSLIISYFVLEGLELWRPGLVTLFLNPFILLALAGILTIIFLFLPNRQP